MEDKKILVLLRGLPGSGKSTIAKQVLDADVLISIDDHFTDHITGEYKFNYKENFKAYAKCEQRVGEAMLQKTAKIVVHNTFVSAEELKPYFKLAEEFDYQVFVMTIEKYHSNQNVHQISDEQIRKMAEKYTVKLY